MKLSSPTVDNGGKGGLCCLHCTKGSSLTLKNGTIATSIRSANSLIHIDGDLTLDGITITGTSSCPTILSISDGTLTIQNQSNISSDSNNVVLDVDKYSEDAMIDVHVSDSKLSGKLDIIDDIDENISIVVDETSDELILPINYKFCSDNNDRRLVNETEDV